MKLFTFWQSGSCYRVRIALNLKNIAYEPVFVRGGRGSQDLRAPEYLKLNPQGVIPTLVDGDRALTQSMAILEYLEEAYPQPPLLPDDLAARARVRALAQTVVSDIHPLITARVIEHLEGTLGLDEDRRMAWLRHWNERGLRAIEKLLSDDTRTGSYCHGERPTLADACLIPHVFTAMRFGCDLMPFATIDRIYAHCLNHPAFQRAAPANQPDAPKARP